MVTPALLLLALALVVGGAAVACVVAVMQLAEGLRAPRDMRVVVEMAGAVAVTAVPPLVLAPESLESVEALLTRLLVGRPGAPAEVLTTPPDPEVRLAQAFSADAIEQGAADLVGAFQAHGLALSPEEAREQARLLLNAVNL